MRRISWSLGAEVGNALRPLMGTARRRATVPTPGGAAVGSSSSSSSSSSGGGVSESVAAASEEDGSGKRAYEAMLAKQRAAREEVSLNAPDPELYQVPTLTITMVERGEDVAKLWRHMLSGKRVLMLTGVDGIGKSTAAAEFCEAVKKTKRFSCVQWFNGRYHLSQQVSSFVHSMRGRKESDVLLVFDDVPCVADVRNVILAAQKVANVVVTTSDPDASAALHAAAGDGQAEAASSLPVHMYPIAPLSSEGCRALGERFHVTDAALADDIGRIVGRVPLLLELAFTAVASGALDASSACADLEGLVGRRENGLSVSAATSALVTLLLERAVNPPGDAAVVRKVLAILACFQLNDLGPGVISALPFERAADAVVAASDALPLLKNKWDDDTFCLHISVARALVDADPSVMATAAEILLKMWPRRWRSAGGTAARSLVWHTVALHQTFQRAGLEPTAPLLTSMERAGAFLVHGGSKDLPVARDLWMSCFVAYRRMETPPPNFADLGVELGKVLLVLREASGAEVLRESLRALATQHGEASVKYALALSIFAPYATAADVEGRRLEQCAAVLSSHAQGGGDDALFDEEVVMYKEAVFVLLARSMELAREAPGTPDEAYTAQRMDELRALASDIATRKSLLKNKKKPKTDR